MAKNKTTENENSVADYLAKITDEKRRNDCLHIIDLFTEFSGFEAKMWGTGIVGFGKYSYQYASGHSGEAPLVAMASRANAITLYLGTSFEQREELLAKFGKYKAGKGCIYIQKLEDISVDILKEMIKKSVEQKVSDM